METVVNNYIVVDDDDNPIGTFSSENIDLNLYTKPKKLYSDVKRVAYYREDDSQDSCQSPLSSANSDEDGYGQYCAIP